MKIMKIFNIFFIFLFIENTIAQTEPTKEVLCSQIVKYMENIKNGAINNNLVGSIVGLITNENIKEKMKNNFKNLEEKYNEINNTIINSNISKEDKDYLIKCTKIDEMLKKIKNTKSNMEKNKESLTKAEGQLDIYLKKKAEKEAKERADKDAICRRINNGECISCMNILGKKECNVCSYVTGYPNIYCPIEFSECINDNDCILKKKKCQDHIIKCKRDTKVGLDKCSYEYHYLANGDADVCF